MKCEIYLDNTSEMRYNISHKIIIKQSLEFVNSNLEFIIYQKEKKCAEFAANTSARQAVPSMMGKVRSGGKE